MPATPPHPPAEAAWDLATGPVRPRQRWAYLSGLLDRFDRGGVGRLSTTELKQVGRLYRQVTIDLAGPGPTAATRTWSDS